MCSMQCCGMSFEIYKSKQCIHVYLKSSLLYGGVIGKLSAYAQLYDNVLLWLLSGPSYNTKSFIFRECRSRETRV